MHLSFRLSLVGLHSQSPRNSLLFLWLCSIKSTKSNPNLSALTGKSFRPRSLSLNKNGELPQLNQFLKNEDQQALIEKAARLLDCNIDFLEGPNDF
jgi:hypothetical protein